MDDYRIILEKHDTKDVTTQEINGTLTVIWRDWDDVVKNHPKMVYISSVNVGGTKGPHIHTKRTSYFSCIEGKVVFIIKGENGYHEIISSPNEPTLVHVPKNVASAHLNISEGVSRVIALADIAWKPNDNEMVNTNFDDYDWNKWKK